MEKPDVVPISAEEYAVEGTSVWVPLTDETLANSISSSCQNCEYDILMKMLWKWSQRITLKSRSASEFTPPVEEINLPTVAAEMALSSSRAEPGPPKSAPLIPPFYKAHSRLMNDPTPGTPCF